MIDGVEYIAIYYQVLKKLLWVFPCSDLINENSTPIAANVTLKKLLLYSIGTISVLSKHKQFEVNSFAS